MASKSTNAKVAALKARHAAELRAVAAVAAAEDMAVTARQRRAAALEGLDRDVAAAGQGYDVALAALAGLIGDDAAASVADVDASEVRAARKRANPDAVDAAVDDARSTVPRSDRPRGARRPARLAGAAPTAGAATAGGPDDEPAPAMVP